MNRENQKQPQPKFEEPLHRTPQHVESKPTEEYCADEADIIPLEKGQELIQQMCLWSSITLLQNHIQKTNKV